jgi:predicted O-methyltransferase YrrM
MDFDAIAKKAIEIGALQKPSELSELLQRVSAIQPRTVVEIGTARGGTLYGLCQVAPDDATIVSVDLPGGQFGGGYDNADVSRFMTYRRGTQRLSCLMADSHLLETRERLTGELSASPIDFLLIDGDHTYQGARLDWEMYAPMVREGGLVALHDICYHTLAPECQVDKLWAELEGQYDSDRIIDHTQDFWGGIGVIRKSEPKKAYYAPLLDIGRGPVQRGFVRLDHDVDSIPWPVGTNSVNICVGAHIIEHVKPWLIMAFFDELWRVVKPGGQVALSTPYAGSMGWWADPTHCAGFNERSFAYLDPSQSAYAVHRPKPWRIEKGNPTWSANGNLEVLLFPIK